MFPKNGNSFKTPKIPSILHKIQHNHPTLSGATVKKATEVFTALKDLHRAPRIPAGTAFASQTTVNTNFLVSVIKAGRKQKILLHAQWI